MSASVKSNRTNRLARVIVACAGACALTATASAQYGRPDFRTPSRDRSYEPVRHVEPVRSVGHGHAPVREVVREVVIAKVWIDGCCFEITECQGIRAGLIEALERRGYKVWCEGYTVVVDTSCHQPRIRFESCEYDLVAREQCEQLRLWARPVVEHHPVVTRPVARPAPRPVEPVFRRPGFDPRGRIDDSCEQPSYRDYYRGRGEGFGIRIGFGDGDSRFEVRGGGFRRD
ncbi:MAG: hypothetical protein R3B68_11955 [Phycisphaerales bacterium]